ncbi:mediator of RNA polymerase II transcription subunit 14-like [Actinia tenebrosa]|uniref:Mediator of RNA polymerase II transcription subunit 14 n=2 Tax=Actinia tenebrosa TaxID=6105 RepID=A0A6P8HD62_ACTTE|nr:mediator of RNA polymerase II transcription subunit 14-like [Actinia tenebrosa]
MAATEDGQGSKINLSMLIDFLLQKTYHELTVLSELLPRKNDIERKIQIVQFASRTRQQFVRLLALVKWAASAERVDKCQVISTFLDQQSMVFVDTADMLARMARETLVQARLPTFCLPAAVDVLTTGTYCRLPTCIRDKIVPPDPITTSEKTMTLQRLNQVIQHRLVISEIPPQMTNIKIDDGRVTFHVDHEFEVSLTLMGDDTSLPWRLLSINILVQDIETGDGMSLVHDLQINYIHQLVQSRLFQEESPLVDLYNCLHTFCLSLQLQVLHFQAKQLITERWHENVKIDSSISEQSFTLYYWRNTSGQQQQQQPLTVQTPTQANKLTISYKSENTPPSLRIIHQPEISRDMKNDMKDVVFPGELCVEKLLMQTVRIQSNVKLINLLNLLSEDLKLNSKVLLDHQNSCLAIHTCSDATPSEVLLITIDTRSGQFRVALGGGEENAICSAMEKALNANPKQFPVLLGDVRCQLHLCKCRRSIAMLPVIPRSYLPISEASRGKLGQLSKCHFYLHFKNHKEYYLVIEVISEENSDKVSKRYHLLHTKNLDVDSLEGTRKDRSTESKDPKQAIKKEAEKQPKTGCQNQSHDKQSLFLEVDHLVEIGALPLTDFPGSPIKGFDQKTSGSSSKRKCINDDQQQNKKPRTTSDLFNECSSVSSYQADLGHVVCLCDARIPFMQLCNELKQNEVVHDGVQSEAGIGLCIPILHLPLPAGCNPDLVSTLQENILSCTLRFTCQDYRQCVFELIFSSSPLQSNSAPSKAECKRVTLTYDSMSVISAPDGKIIKQSAVQLFLEDWCSMCKLYPHTLELDLCLKDNTSHVRHMFHIESYTYKQLTIQYEPDRQNLVTVQWSVTEKQFVLSFGHGGSSGMDNPHRIMAEHLQKDFNKRLNLPYLIQILHETWKPLSSINKLTTMPQLGVITRPHMAQRTFSVLPVSPTSVHIIYRSNALEVHFKAKNLVSIRDASLSFVDPSKPRNLLSSIPSLKQFLQLFVDDIAMAGGIPSRRTSEADDEVPPSPVGMDTEPTEIQFTSPQPMPSQSIYVSPNVPSSSSRGGFTPSPNPINAPSPSNPYSSPSPATSFLGHSPAHSFMQSPGPWSPLPGGSQVNKYRQNPAVSGPSRQPTTPPRPLIAKPWASTTPTILSHTAFNRLCSPVHRYDRNVSHLEMFLGSMFLKKHLCRAIQGDELIQFPKIDSTLVAFKTSSLQCVVKLDTSTYTSLRLNVKPIQGQEAAWMRDELTSLERFFETRVASAPYRASSMTSFARCITFPTNILKDLIKIIRLETIPDQSHKWRVEWCLSIPPDAPEMPATPGTPAVVFKAKLFIFIQLKKASSQGTSPLDDSVMIPLLFDPKTNTTQQVDVSRQASAPTSSAEAAVNALLKRWNESPASKTGDCTIFPAVLELAKNLVIPT